MYPNGLYGVFGDQYRYRQAVPYGSISLTESSPAQSFEEVLEVAEVQSYLKLPIRSGDEGGQDDALLANILIPGAREVAEILQGRDLVQKQWDLVFDHWPCAEIELRPPLISVDLVRYRDSAGAYTTLVADTDYVVDTAKQPAVIVPPYGQSWPTYTAWPSSSLLVRFSSGLASDAAFWRDRGPRLKLGMLRLISDWYNSRLPFGTPVEEMPYGVTSALSFGAVPRAR